MEPNLIYQCADHRDFLRRFLQSRKTPGGLRALARRAGFKSPGHLAMLVSGERRLTLRSAELLASAFALKGRKRSLWLAYAKLDAARSERERCAARDEIQRLKSLQPECQLRVKQYAFLATWYYPVLFVLIHQPSTDQEPANLARRLRHPVSTAAIGKAFQDMADLGLIKRDSHGRWMPIEAVMTTPEDVRDAAIGRYHRNSLKLAEEALELPMRQREFNGVTVSIPQRLLPAVKEKIRRFRSELNEMLASETETAEVYQFNLHLFPLTKGDL